MLGAIPQQGLTVRVRTVSLEEVREVLKSTPFTSAVGHESTASVLTLLTGVSTPVNRVAIKLAAGDKLIVFQLQVRLQEGQVLSAEEVFALYNEGKASFMLVEVQE